MISNIKPRQFHYLSALGSLLALITVFLMAANADQAETCEWLDMSQGSRLSAESGRPMLLYFEREGDGWCRQFNKRVFEDPEIWEDLCSTCVPIRVPEKQARKSQFKVRGFPTVAVVSSEGCVAVLRPGYHKAREFQAMYQLAAKAIAQEESCTAVVEALRESIKIKLAEFARLDSLEREKKDSLFWARQDSLAREAEEYRALRDAIFPGPDISIDLGEWGLPGYDPGYSPNDGKMTCQMCKGTGKYGSCEVCAGSGYVWNGQFTSSCGPCNGKGISKCKTCGGLGYLR